MLRWGAFSIVAGVGVTALASSSLSNDGPSDVSHAVADVARLRQELKALPKRADHLARLKDPSHTFDVLIVGGGATGTGIALDCSTRGLDVALVEQEDFAAGTSSRSTKLIHGGVRYLEQAVKNLDYKQLKLVFEALHERTTFVTIAPHLSKPIPIMTPCYQWWEAPYYWVGMKVYDLVAGSHKLYGLTSRFVGAEESLRQFPMLQKDGFKGSIVYYDGQMNDARMNVSLALTASQHGAAVANHVKVISLRKDSGGKVCGAVVKDMLSGEEFPVSAKSVINATGPFVDTLCSMDEGNHVPLVVPSAGIHIVLPDYYSPQDMGMIIPRTKDGRVVFMLPWEGRTIAGTTDAPSGITMRPQGSIKEVDFILESISEYLQVQVRRSDVTSTWAGIRPLARDPTAKDTKTLSRDHVIIESASGLVTITGGKWTTYRRMAQEATDTLLKSHKDLAAKASKCTSSTTPLVGTSHWSPAFYTVLSQQFTRKKRTSAGGYETAAMHSELAKHLSHFYGDRSILVADLCAEGYGRRLAERFPFQEAEVVYAVRHELACTIMDIVARRTSLAFLDLTAAIEALPVIANIMQAELGWSSAQKEKELATAREFLSTFAAHEIESKKVTEEKK